MIADLTGDRVADFASVPKELEPQELQKLFTETKAPAWPSRSEAV